MGLETIIDWKSLQQSELWAFLMYHPDKEINQAAKREQARRRRNANRRATNEMLRELCGTSARAAREDMGLAKG